MIEMSDFNSIEDSPYDHRLATPDDIIEIVQLADKEIGENTLSIKNVANLVGVNNIVVCTMSTAFGEKIVGFMISSKLNEATVALNNILIEEKHRGQKLGSGLLESFIYSCRYVGFERIQALVNQSEAEQDRNYTNNLLTGHDFYVEKVIEDTWNTFNQCKHCGHGSSCRCSGVLFVRDLEPLEEREADYLKS